MEKKDYVFLNTFYDKEMLRIGMFILEQEQIDFQVVNKTTHGSVRAPLSVYFEADIQVLSRDFEKAAILLERLME